MAQEVMGILDRIERSRDVRRDVQKMLERQSEFRSPLAAKIAAIAGNPDGRAYLDREMDRMWSREGSVRPPNRVPEVVIGAGLHAAIYSAVRVAQGHPAPLVLEAADRVGGAFAVSQNPTFYLNSRNRPGNLSVPGQLGALNVLPEAVIQPCDLSGDDYQRNTDLALVIRMTLAMNAKVKTGRSVISIEKSKAKSRYRLDTLDGSTIGADRVIIASGLGTPREIGEPFERSLTFPQFMARMDGDFPLRGLKNVAVVGKGDSGKTVIEALTGQGPLTHSSVASLDWVERIDWYGVPELNREAFCGRSRSRYQGIGRLFPKTAGGEGRVQPRTETVSDITDGYECVYVNERPYDLVVVCTGYEDDGITTPWSQSPFGIGGRIVASRYGFQEIFAVGPAARIEPRDLEKGVLGTIPENSTALFRYASRTAVLATSLGKEGSVTTAKASKPKRTPVGNDQNGEALFVGDVASYGVYSGEILGFAENRPGLIALDTTGGYSVIDPNGKRQTDRYGVRPDQVIKGPAEAIPRPSSRSWSN